MCLKCMEDLTDGSKTLIPGDKEAREICEELSKYCDKYFVPMVRALHH